MEDSASMRGMGITAGSSCRKDDGFTVTGKGTYSPVEEWAGVEGREPIPDYIKSNPGCDNGFVVILFLISLSVRDAY